MADALYPAIHGPALHAQGSDTKALPIIQKVLGELEAEEGEATDGVRAALDEIEG
ncbi:MAG: hypothetical protein ACI8X5_003742 [Planctomycetota bacterium]